MVLLSFFFLYLLSCVISIIQAQPPPPPAPHPAPHPAPNPEPYAPEPHSPEPVPTPHPVPQPNSPEPVPSPEPEPAPHPGSEPAPHPGSEPEPAPHPGAEPMPEPAPEPEHHMPEPAPEPEHPMPEPMPQPAPAPSIPPYDLMELQSAVNSPKVAMYGGAIALTGSNDTITVFGGKNQAVVDYVWQYSMTAKTWTNISAWNTSHPVISYSQPVPDATNSYGIYPLYYLWHYANQYYVNKITFPDPSTPLFNLTFPDEDLDQTGEGPKIAALPTGDTVFVYSLSGLRVFSGGKLEWVNTTGTPPGRLSPAIVTYNNGFLMQGGYVGTNRFTDFWQYTHESKTWISVNYNGTQFPPADRHTATLSNLDHTYVYFTGLPTKDIMIYDATSKILSTFTPSNKTSYTSLHQPLTTVSGNRLFIFGGATPGLIPSPHLYQMVTQSYCTSIGDCENCVGVIGCTFCKSALAANLSSCVAGDNSGAYDSSTCADPGPQINLVEYCPEIFPSWAIALIVIGGVILVGGIVFGIMKLRSGKPGYDPV